MTIQEEIQLLQTFREKVEMLRNGEAEENTRSQIGQMKSIVSKIMTRVGTLKYMQLYPPPIIGGPVLQVNPIETLYDVPFGMEYKMRGYMLDMLDETIGLLNDNESSSMVKKFDVWCIMHPTIISVSQLRFTSGWYADAVEAAFKEINARVKDMYVSKGLPEKDGYDLMFSAFPKNSPNIYLSDLSNRSEQDVQEGYMHMFAGAMLGIRNPKAHANESISQEDALRKLAFASMLMYKLDSAKIG